MLTLWPDTTLVIQLGLAPYFEAVYRPYPQALGIDEIFRLFDATLFLFWRQERHIR